MKHNKHRRIVNPRLPGRYGKMTPAEFDKEVEKFDQEFIADQARPLTSAERLHDQRLLRRRRGRCAVARAKRVVITLEHELLHETDLFAKRLGLTRAALIARALRSVLGRTG